MKDFRNYVILILAALLALSIVIAPANNNNEQPPTTVSQYDPVLLAEYTACLNSLPTSSFYYAGREARDTCKWWYPIEGAKPPLSPNFQAE